MADDDWGAFPIAKPADDWSAFPISGAPKPESAGDMSWGEAGKSALQNIPSSAVQFGKDLVQPVMHPIDTATNVGHIGHGVLQKLGIVSGDEQVPYADAVGKFVMDRYGSMDAVKHTLAHDPVGMAADLSTILSGGSALAARAPGLVGKAGQIAGTVGRAIDPLSAVATAAKPVGKVASELVGNLGTHTGGESLRLAARAGYEGGPAAAAFQENMRGIAPMDDALTEARMALDTIRRQRAAEYQSGMATVAGSNAILDFSKIDRALANSAGVKSYKGQSLSPKTQGIRDEIEKAVGDWKALSPADFHTAEGIDALKQKVGDIRDAAAYGTPERVVADRAYHAIRQTIVDQVPSYAKVMKGYEEASKQIKEIERTLSLNPNASVDTALRKLQSVLRNNVNTNYGQRGVLANYLVNSGAPNLMFKLAGQSLSSATPRGLGKLSMALGAEIAASAAGHAAMGGLGAGLGVGATLPFMSPRLMGEAAYYGGKLGRGASYLPLRTGTRADYQVGRDTEFQSERGPLKVRVGPDAAGFASGGSVDDKLTKPTAHYRAGTKAKRCGLCTMFRPPHGCTAVQGKVVAGGLCDLFKRKVQGKAEGGPVEDDAPVDAPDVIIPPPVSGLTNRYVDPNHPLTKALAERIRPVVDAAKYPGDVLAGREPLTLGLRPEDYTDDPHAPDPSERAIGKAVQLTDLATTGAIPFAQKGAAGVFGGKLGGKRSGTINGVDYSGLTDTQAGLLKEARAAGADKPAIEKMVNHFMRRAAPDEVAVPIHDRVVRAFHEIAGNPPLDSVRLSKLREKLSDIPSADLNSALAEMHRSGAANLMHLDNPRDIATEASSAVKIGNDPRHVIWIPGKASGGSVGGKFNRGGAVNTSRKARIVRTFDVPYLAGSSDDNRTVYIDRRVPSKIKVKLANGKGYRVIDPAIPLSIHEQSEHHAMNEGKSYEDAHVHNGTADERAWVEAQGLDWKHYEEILDGLLDHIEHEKPKRVARNLYTKPYPHDKAMLLKRLGKSAD